MYRVLIAEDESIVRENICQCIPWQRMELELVATVDNGRDAREQVLALRPDIVITDIMMPFLNGLEFIEAIQQEDYRPLLIILTGYDDFDYVHKALTLGAFDYILKPVEQELLCRVLQKAQAKLDSQQASLSEIEELRLKVKADASLSLQRTFLKYLHHRLDYQEFQERLPEDILEGRFFTCVLLQIDRFDSMTSAMNEEEIFALTQKLEQCIFDLSMQPLVLIEEFIGHYILVFYGAEQSEIRLFRDTFLRTLREANIDLSYTTACAPVKDRLAAIGEAYEQANDTMYRSFILGKNRDLTYSETQDVIETPYGFDISAVIASIASFNKAKIKAEFDTLEEKIRSTGMNSYLFTRLAVSCVYAEIVKLLAETRCPVQDMIEDHTLTYNKIMKCQTLEGVMEELYQFVAQICDAVSGNKSSANKRIILEAKAYMQKNFRNPKLTLEAVASEVNLSPNYFSVQFKQTTGESFINCLTNMRIENAKKLLNSGGYRAYEAAYASGYDNPTYFSTIFKKRTGVSPSELIAKGETPV